MFAETNNFETIWTPDHLAEWSSTTVARVEIRSTANMVVVFEPIHISRVVNTSVRILTENTLNVANVDVVATHQSLVQLKSSRHYR